MDGHEHSPRPAYSVLSKDELEALAVELCPAGQQDRLLPCPDPLSPKDQYERVLNAARLNIHSNHVALAEV